MARVKNTMRLINSSIGKINNNYDMTVQNVRDIEDATNETYDLITYGFCFGYIQGMKAAKAEMKKGGVVQ